MTAEVGPLMKSGKEPVQKKLQLTVVGKAPRNEFLKAGLLKRPWKYQPGIVALNGICQFQKSTEVLICKCPFSCLVHEIAQEVGKIWPALPGACSSDSAGSCRILSGWPPGRHLPLCDPCKVHHNNAQGYPISPYYPWKASSLLSSSSSPKSVLVFLLDVGCVGSYWYKGRECN